MKILKLNQAGMPHKWISLRRAAEYYAHGKVLWDLADEALLLRGGTNMLGVQSTLAVAPIIAVAGRVYESQFKIPLTNDTLFARDEHTCLYCSRVGGRLTRDHIIPKGQGGPDVWTNVATSCFKCNTTKGCRTPLEARMQLIAVPYEPTWFELLFLRNRKATAEQINYLKPGFRNIEVS
jgi:hypothetical protein